MAACATALSLAPGAGAEEEVTDVADPAQRAQEEGYPAAEEGATGENTPSGEGEARGLALMGQATAAATVPRRPAATPLRLPGFAGAPHIYHYGATGFFLDRPEAAVLTAAQRATLARIRAAAQNALAFADRRIASAEQELWNMTASETPDAAAMESKLSQIERLRTQQRVTFIRYVGAAARVLSHEQRLAITGAPAPRPTRVTPPRPAPAQPASRPSAAQPQAPAAQPQAPAAQPAPQAPAQPALPPAAEEPSIEDEGPAERE